MLETKLSNWGNSKAVRIPKEIIHQLQLKDNQALDIFVENDTINIKTKRKFPETIHELFEDYKTQPFSSKELDWGKPKGEEIEW